MINSCLCAYKYQWVLWRMCVCVCTCVRAETTIKTRYTNKKHLSNTYATNRVCVYVLSWTRYTHTHTNRTSTTTKPAAQICAAIECDQSVLCSVLFCGFLSPEVASESCTGALASLQQHNCDTRAAVWRHNITESHDKYSIYDSIFLGFPCI